MLIRFAMSASEQIRRRHPTFGDQLSSNTFDEAMRGAIFRGARHKEAAGVNYNTN